MSERGGTWQEQNRAYLALAIDELRQRLGIPAPRSATAAAVTAAAKRMDDPPALVTLATSLELDAFERDVVLLLAAGELDPGDDFDPQGATVGHALGALPDAHWHALDAGSPLRRWGIVEVDADPGFVTARMHLAEDVLRYLLGFDPREGGAPVFTSPPQPLRAAPSQLAAAAELVRTIALTGGVTGVAPAAEVHGAAAEDRFALAELTARELGATIAAADVTDLPVPGPDLDALFDRWNRCAVLTATVLLITGADADDPTARERLGRALSRITAPFFISVRTPSTVDPTRPIVRREAPELTAAEREDAWTACADASRARLRIRQVKPLRAAIAELATDYRLGTRTIERVCLEAESLYVAGEGEDDGLSPAEQLGARMREGCARAVRARMDPLAERLPVADVPDVALPGRERIEIEEIERQIRLSHRVDVEWGMARGRDRGITALFAGPSGTGKTHAATALARRLGLDLYRVNVAGVLSKYIGETEQNLDRIFEAARPGGVMLLFDEADALFGRRTEVKDAHDRYANLGTAYLLQRIEAAPTPTILTTNMKEGIDPAFTRRLHFVVDFPFPREVERERIWETIFPEGVPTRGLDSARLSQLAVPGGAISNIARRGAFLAAADGGVVEMRHLLEGAITELRKVDRELSAEETAGWL